MNNIGFARKDIFQVWKNLEEKFGLSVLNLLNK
jgi:hypothetical protein